MSRSLRPELVVDAKCILGEGPLWSPREGRLHWTDTVGEAVFAYDPAYGDLQACSVPASVAAMTVQADGRRLLFMPNGRIDVWSGDTIWTAQDASPELESVRFTAVCAAPDGGILGGVLSEAGMPSFLARMTPVGAVRPLLANWGLAGGIAFTPGAKQVVVSDCIEGTVTRFAYGGDLTRSALLHMELREDVWPGGVAVDAEGCVWWANDGAGCVVRQTPNGEIDLQVDLPCPRVHGLAFGGPRQRDLYVTTGLSSDTPQKGGGLFRIRAPVPGVPAFTSRLEI